ncbi:MAG: hypothetical protein JNJ40_00420 [Bacteroidia bacterium]|nr:hypothetical protein [Bacteroidia bacterium]
MKTFIYLPLIALIILTGCKSNSFTTQRYTKFGHASHKKTEHVPQVGKAKQAEPEKTESEVVKQTINPATIITAGASTLKDAILKPERKVYNSNKNSFSAAPVSESVDNDATFNSENSKQVVKSKRTFKQKVQKAEGVIESAFLTALWIVLVVIFICIILFVLAAVF